MMSVAAPLWFWKIWKKKIVKKRNLWARLEIERRFLNEYNLVDDGLNINM